MEDSFKEPTYCDEQNLPARPLSIIGHHNKCFLSLIQMIYLSMSTCGEAGRQAVRLAESLVDSQTYKEADKQAGYHLDR